MTGDRAGRVVVGVDSTLSGLQALRRAVAEARARGVPLVAVRTWTPATASVYPMLPNQREEEVAAASQLVTRAFADTLGGLPTDVEVETLLVPDAPGPALVRIAAWDDDLLVVGTGRRGSWRRMSRTARYCLGRATCPVLVVPPPPLTRGASQRTLLRELRRDLDQLASDGPGT
jgi:nucleotide-binding universal stress UspA family protein